MKQAVFVVRLACVFVVTTAGDAWAQDSATTSPSAIAAMKAIKPPVIDGGVADDEWQTATPVAGFIQYEPQRGERSQLQTEARVLYDAGHLYVAFRAWDPEPITAQLTQRDADLLRDDAVVLVRRQHQRPAIRLLLHHQRARYSGRRTHSR
jgi:hypothetical protein